MPRRIEIPNWTTRGLKDFTLDIYIDIEPTERDRRKRTNKQGENERNAEVLIENERVFSLKIILIN